MKIKRATREKTNNNVVGFMTNRCKEGTAASNVKGASIRVGTTLCHECPRFWFRVSDIVVCHGKNKKEANVG